MGEGRRSFADGREIKIIMNQIDSDVCLGGLIIRKFILKLLQLQINDCNLCCHYSKE